MYFKFFAIIEIFHPIIDAQHQELFRITNRFYDEINKRSGPTCFAKPYPYIQEHFEAEEKIMKAMYFLLYDEHAAIHESLILEIFELHKECENMC